MSDESKAFREYATRVSFNISLSRNQIFCLWNCEQEKTGGRDEALAFGCAADMFVPGAKWLGQHGLVTWTDPVTMTPKWSRHPYQLTEAGKHVLALLRIAGLVPQRAVNSNAKDKKAKRA